MNDYLTDIDKQAEEMFSQLVKELAERDGITETLKATDQMEWVRQMNGVWVQATEIVNNELIYKLTEETNMKKLIALIIAIIALIGVNINNPTKPAETPVIDPTSTVIETVKEEPPETEEPQAEPSMAVTEESKTKVTETEPVITEPKQETKPRIDKPKEQMPPAETEKVENGGIVIGNPTPTQTYSCDVPGHHCTGPETHSFICELEQKGCEYCGSHSCPSFYAVDEWGQGCYTPSKCPKYDIHTDPVYYCQTCHKHCGDGRNGTCVQFVIDCTCPNCGEQVKAWTCHYCG